MSPREGLEKEAGINTAWEIIRLSVGTAAPLFLLCWDGHSGESLDSNRD